MVVDKHTTQADIAVQKFGTVAALFDAALLNNAGITDDLEPGSSWVLPNAVYEPVNISIPAPATQPVLFEMLKHQELTDFTTQRCGTLSSLFEVAQLNGLSITDDVAPGTMLKQNVAEPAVVRFFTNKRIDIVNLPKPKDVKPGGIGYMQIGNDFIVS